MAVMCRPSVPCLQVDLGMTSGWDSSTRTDPIVRYQQTESYDRHRFFMGSVYPQGLRLVFLGLSIFGARGGTGSSGAAGRR